MITTHVVDVRSSSSRSWIVRTQLVGNSLRNCHLPIEASKKVDLFDENEVMRRAAIGDDDHRLGRIPRSRCTAISASTSAAEYPPRSGHVMFLQKGVHLEPAFSIAEQVGESGFSVQRVRCDKPRLRLPRGERRGTSSHCCVESSRNVLGQIDRDKT